MAGAGKKTFTAGEVLTASDTNQFLMEQTVMVFGGTAARSSAIPTPSEGMTTYRTDTQQIESYDGAEWRGMSGLQLVKKQTIGSAVSSVTVTSAFSATYDNYKIIISGGVGSAGGANLAFQLGSTTTNYVGVLNYANFNGTSNSPAGSSGNNWTFLGSADTNGTNFSAELTNPFLSKNTYVQGQYIATLAGGSFTGRQNSTTSFTDFTIYPNTGTLTGGTIYVYGFGA